MPAAFQAHFTDKLFLTRSSAFFILHYGTRAALSTWDVVIAMQSGQRQTDIRQRRAVDDRCGVGGEPVVCKQIWPVQRLFRGILT